MRHNVPHWLFCLFNVLVLFVGGLCFLGCLGRVGGLLGHGGGMLLYRLVLLGGGQRILLCEALFLLKRGALLVFTARALLFCLCNGPGAYSRR